MILRLSENYTGVAIDPVTIAALATSVAKAAKEISAMFGGGAEAEAQRLEALIAKIQSKPENVFSQSTDSEKLAAIKKRMSDGRNWYAQRVDSVSGGQRRVYARNIAARTALIQTIDEILAKRGQSFEPKPDAPTTEPSETAGMTMAGFNIPTWLPLVAIGGVLLSQTKFLK